MINARRLALSSLLLFVAGHAGGCIFSGPPCRAGQTPAAEAIVVDAAGNAVEDAVVEYSVDGGTFTRCESSMANVFDCAPERTGSITVRATRGTATASHTITASIPGDGCGVGTQQFMLTLS